MSSDLLSRTHPGRACWRGCYWSPGEPRKEDPFTVQMWRLYVRTRANFIWRISTCTSRVVGMDPTRGADAGVALLQQQYPHDQTKDEHTSTNRWMSPSVDAKDPEVWWVGSIAGPITYITTMLAPTGLFYFISMTANEVECNTVPPQPFQSSTLTSWIYSGSFKTLACSFQNIVNMRYPVAGWQSLKV